VTSRARDGVFVDPGYAQACRLYRRPPERAIAEYLEELRRLLADTVRPVVVDLGCGPGTFLLPLERLAHTSGGHVLAVDRSPAMVDLARRLVADAGAERRVVLRVGDFHRLVLPEACALTWASDVIHLVPDLDTFFGHTARLLGSRGAIAVRMSSHHQLRSYEWGAFFPEARALDLEAHPDVDRVCAALRRNGFHAVRVREVDESRWMATGRYLRLFESRYLSSLRMIDDATFASGMQEMRRACGGRRRIKRNGQMTLIVGRTADAD
jgi:SAM-dependent methyltransferase